MIEKYMKSTYSSLKEWVIAALELEAHVPLLFCVNMYFYIVCVYKVYVCCFMLFQQHIKMLW